MGWIAILSLVWGVSALVVGWFYVSAIRSSKGFELFTRPRGRGMPLFERMTSHQG